MSIDAKTTLNRLLGNEDLTQDEAAELAKFELPEQFAKPVCELKGVYALEDDVKAWLKKELKV